MDGRRSRWIAFDVEFYGKRTGSSLYKRFGSAGVALWLGFLCACKSNRIQGRISYFNDTQCLAELGLVGLRLVNEDGEPFTLDEFWSWLGNRKQVRRRRVSGDVTDVIATRWEEWQNAHQRHDGDPNNGRSPRRNTERIRKSAEPYTDTDSDITPPTPPRGVCSSCQGRGEVLPYAADTMEPCPDCNPPALRVVQ